MSLSPTLKRDDDLGVVEAFGRDRYLELEVRRMVAAHGILTMVETGSWRGYTTRCMASFVRRVHTIEISPDFQSETKATTIDLKNVTMHPGDSAEILPKLIPTLPTPTMYYLDAHWGPMWPLFDELYSIAQLDPRPVIVIHDMQVPDRDFGFDTYNGKALTYEVVRPCLTRLQCKWTYRYNRQAQGHRRGVMFVEPE